MFIWNCQIDKGFSSLIDSQDKVVIPLRAAAAKAGADEDTEAEDDPVLVVHPNYVIE